MTDQILPTPSRPRDQLGQDLKGMFFIKDQHRSDDLVAGVSA